MTGPGAGRGAPPGPARLSAHALAAPTCALCDLPIDGPVLGDPLGADDYHPACAADRLAHDAVAALIAALVLVLAPVAVVWAG